MSNFFQPTTLKALKTAPVLASVAGDNEIVEAIIGKRIKVVAFLVQAAAGTNTIKWKDGDSLDLSGALTFNVREGVASSIPPPYWMFATSAGNALILNCTSTETVSGFVTYFDDDPV